MTIGARSSKHRRKDVLPLRPDVAQVLREYTAGKPKSARVWPGGEWNECGAEMVRLDLEAGGIPYADDAGRVVDYHALRHTFLTHLAESGVYPKVAQVLARHSTIVLMMDRYTHLGLADQVRGLEKLPDLPAPKPTKES